MVASREINVHFQHKIGHFGDSLLYVMMMKWHEKGRYVEIR